MEDRRTGTGPVRVQLTSARPSLLGEVVGRLVDTAPGFSSGPAVVGDPTLADVPDPGVVLVEVTGEDESRLHAAAVRQRWPEAALLLLATDGGAWCGRLVSDVGAAGWVTCELQSGELLSAIDDAARKGKLRRAAPRASSGRRAGEALQFDLLSGREREVLDFLGAGCRLDYIAQQLNISRHTVRTHVQNLITKLAVHSRLEAVALARRAGALESDQLIKLRPEPSFARPVEPDTRTPLVG